MGVDTRDRLVAATCEVLVEHGWGGATTAQIASRAGLAEGTIFRHFPTKAELVTATCAAVLDDVRTAASEALLTLRDDREPDEPITVADAVGVVWDLYGRDDLVAVHECFVIARTDAALAELLVAYDGPHRDAVEELARAALPHLADRPELRLVVDLVIDAVAGAAQGVRRRDPADARRRLAVIVAAAERLLEGPTLDLAATTTRRTAS